MRTFPTYNDGENVMHYKGRNSRYAGTIPKMPAHALIELGITQARLDRMAAKVPLDEPWKAPRAKEWDSITLETWLRRNVRTSGARKLIRIAVAAVFAAEPGDLSLLHFLFYSHSGGFLDRLVNVAGGAQELRFVGGSQRIAIKLAASLDTSVRLRTPVRKIVHTDDSVEIRTDETTFRSRYAIVTVPPPLARSIEFEPALPEDKKSLLEKMPMGSVIKVMATYDEPFWRSDGLTGQVTSDAGPVGITFDNSPPEGRPGVLLGFIEGRDAKRASGLTREVRMKEVIESFVRYFGNKADSPNEYIELDWSKEEWTRGCYGAHMRPGTLTAFGPSLRQPTDRIHWAGTESADVWCGYMDGAIRSGERAAREILGAL